MWQWLELEEQIGRYWHRLIGQPAQALPHYSAAAVTFQSLQSPLRTFFHGMGGNPSLPLTASLSQTTHHRRSLRQRLSEDRATLPLAVFSSERLLLPAEIAFFPESALNRQCYFWLTAFCAQNHTTETPLPTDPLQADLVYLHRVTRISQLVCQRFPGLKQTYQQLRAQLLQSRPQRTLPPQEQTVETIVRVLLGQSHAAIDATTTDLLARIQQTKPDFDDLQADKKYHSFLPVPLWPLFQLNPQLQHAERIDPEIEQTGNRSATSKDPHSKKAHRRKFEQSERDDPLLLNRFEKLLTWSDMVNVNRPVEDDEETAARDTADATEELAITAHQRKVATLLKFDLDLSPADVDPTRIFADLTYPEWDYRRQHYHPAHCRVICRTAQENGELWAPDDKAVRIFRRIRRQFEALRPEREKLSQQPEGSEFDLDALVRAQADLSASGQGSDRLYLTFRQQARNLAVMILMDVSLSTDSWMRNRRVLDIEKEALVALSTGMAACQDTFAIYTFTSRKRNFVQLTTIKDFATPFSHHTLRRIAALRPGYYTRIGAALRHTSQLLAQRPERHRLLLLLSDGKPNDLDHYEGHYGIEDTRQAVLEARRQGLNLFGITIDQEARDYFPYLFGRGHYAIINRPERLIEIVPALYRQLTG